MKAQINKSEVMKRAWKIFRGNNPYSYSFSAALCRAWEVEKSNAAYQERKAQKDSAKTDYRQVLSASFEAGCAAYYRNAVQGQYFGD